MTEADLRAIALVRAVEQTNPDLIPQTAVVEATLVAGDPQDGTTWLARRAHSLLRGPLARFRPAVEHVDLRVGTLGWIVPTAFLLGLSGNYLGPTRKVHVLFNPIGLLVLWNLAVYVALAAHRMRGTHHRAQRVSKPANGAGDATTPLRPTSAGSERRIGAGGGFFGRLLLDGLLRRAVAAQMHARTMWGDVRSAGDLVRAFVENWFASIRPSLRHAIRCALHLGAIGMALGAVVGMYMRGLFVDYAVVWRSTFLIDPELVAGLLRAALAPAAMLLGGTVPTAADATALMSEPGSPAARWIHLLAATVLLFVVIPRVVLAVISAVAFQRTTTGLSLPPDDPYLQNVLARAARLDVRAVQDGIRADIGKVFEAFIDQLAGFVAAELYGKRIEPALDDFRENGGRLVDFEARLGELCTSFEPNLRVEIGRRQSELERQVTESIAWRLGEVAPQQLDGNDVLARAGGAASSASRQAGDRMGGNVATGVSAAVTAAVGAVAGTLSGGFGHALGTAVLLSVIHSGPIAWVVGAVAGAVAAGAILYLGKDKLREGVKRVSLPAPLLKLALLRIEKVKSEGREQCRRMVRDELARHIETEQVVERTAEGIWSRLAPELSERLRPAWC
jgi:Protein of unknown function (DUF2868)